METFVASTW
jgi:hypothetical protein